MKAQSLKELLRNRFLFIILFAIILISIFSTILNLNLSIKNEKRAMNEALRQAQINVETHMSMVEDYLSLAISSPVIQKNLTRKNESKSQIMENINSSNEILMSIDLFKKSLSSLNLFVFSNVYPSYSIQSKYSNTIFSSKGTEAEIWFINTLSQKGKTHWFIDENNTDEITINASRTVLDCSNPSRILGVIRATIPLKKYIEHLNSISFGNKGYAFLATDQTVYYDGNKVSIESINEKMHKVLSNYIEVVLPIKSTHWNIMGMISYSILYQNALKNLVLIFIVFMITTLIASLLFVSFSNKISYPISSLCNQMNLMKKIHLPHTNSTCIEIYQLYNTYNCMLDDMQSLMLAREDALKKLKHAELSFLQAQMNPHFIYNTLQSLNSLISLGNNNKAILMVNNLGSFLRNVLTSEDNSILLEKEIQQVVSYFKIQQIRYSDAIHLDLKIPDPVPKYKIIKLILQPLVENSLIHGFSDINYIGIITIHIYEDEQWLYLEVSDNGLGTDTEMLNHLLCQQNEKKSESNFYCIQNIYRRLHACYGQNSAFSYEENKTGGVTSKIKILKSIIDSKEGENNAENCTC